MKTEIVFNESVWKRLEDVRTENTAVLLGWEKDQSLYCTGFAKLPQEWNLQTNLDAVIRRIVGHFPCGFQIIGLYRWSKEEAVRNDCKCYLDTLIAPASIEELVTDPLLICVWKRIDDTTTAFLYDTESEIITDANIETRKLDVQDETVSMLIKGSLALCFDVDNDLEVIQTNVLNAIESAKKKITSPCCTFYLPKASLLLHNSTEKPYLGWDLKASCSCGDLLSYAKTCDGDNKSKNLIPDLEFKVMFLTTGKDATEQTMSCVPVIRYERRLFEAASVVVGIEMLVSVPVSLSLSRLSAKICQGICCQLDTFAHSITTLYREKQTLVLPEVHHFLIPTFDHLISVVYPKNFTEDDLEPLRRDVHQLFFLPLDKPLMRRSMAYLPKGNRNGDVYLQNVHLGLPPSGIEAGITAMVHGNYSYHHYMQDHMSDDGWGCAYRSLQTVISWFRHQGYTNAPIPSHVEIQKTLVEIGDKPASFINSRQWIGSMEVSFCLEKLLGVTSKIMSVSSGSELSSKGRELINHFNTQGTPIMIGGGVLAHTILGVDFNVNTGDIKFLVLDPHYTGSEDINIIQKKGWCGWKGIGFWNKTAYYNLCCPQRPHGI